MPVLSIHHYKENIKYRKETKRIFSIKIQPIMILGVFMKKREIILTIGGKRHALPASNSTSEQTVRVCLYQG